MICAREPEYLEMDQFEQTKVQQAKDSEGNLLDLPTV